MSTARCVARIRSFAPVSRADARVLVLGSMPGKMSLQQQYYAHPQNAFWKIMGELVGAAPALPYPERLQRLRDSGIALWDVLASCERASSLDAHISGESANDFASFFARHPHITQVFFNDSKAEQSFRKFVRGRQVLPPLHLQRLPSTSPAHAGMRYADKLTAWRAVMRHPATRPAQ
jgi:hypoxanthine-DNA glycosylase